MAGGVALEDLQQNVHLDLKLRAEHQTLSTPVRPKRVQRHMDNVNQAYQSLVNRTAKPLFANGQVSTDGRGKKVERERIRTPRRRQQADINQLNDKAPWAVRTAEKTPRSPKQRGIRIPLERSAEVRHNVD